MSWFSAGFDPYRWVTIRNKGKGVYFVDHGLLPGLAAGIGYALLMVLFGSDTSPFLNAALFALAATPIYVFLSYRAWEINEDAFAVWVAQEGRRLIDILDREEQG